MRPWSWLMNLTLLLLKSNNNINRMFERQDKMLEQQGEMLKQQGKMLEILLDNKKKNSGP